MICLVCEPVHLRIEQAINSFQREALEDPPDRDLALAQHAGLVGALEGLGVEVLAVEPSSAAPYQVFVRDVLIGGLGTPIVARLREPVRSPETEVVREALRAASIPFVECSGGYLEGG